MNIADFGKKQVSLFHLNYSISPAKPTPMVTLRKSRYSQYSAIFILPIQGKVSLPARRCIIERTVYHFYNGQFIVLGHGKKKMGFFIQFRFYV